MHTSGCVLGNVVPNKLDKEEEHMLLSPGAHSTLVDEGHWRKDVLAVSLQRLLPAVSD